MALKRAPTFVGETFAFSNVYVLYDINNTGLQIMGLYLLLAYQVRILRYLRLCARKVGVFATFEVMYRAQELFFFYLKCHNLALLFPFKMNY